MGRALFSCQYAEKVERWGGRMETKNSWQKADPKEVVHLATAGPPDTGHS